MALPIGAEARARLTAWWNNEHSGGRPCVLAQTPREERADGDEPLDVGRFWTDAAYMARLRHRHALNRVYWGEAVPYLYMDYGANAMALQLGAEGRWTSAETIWVDPCLTEVAQAAERTLKGPWADRQARAIEEGLRLGAGQMLLSSYCLGAPADLTAALYGTEELLYALVDEPEDVERAFAHIKDVIIEHFLSLRARCAAGGTILNGWHGIWAPDATTPLQEDFSYMIGPEMFGRFCLPHIRDIAEAVPYAFYHLDGVGARKHLAALLEVPQLRVIQWQPGAGRMRMGQWLELIRKILDAGKSCQVYASVEDAKMLTRELGPARMLYILEDTTENILRLADEWRLPANECEGARL